mmetsp:Transcript_62770/g.101691  ORF Transcript_62770/g.101691 Transcript_62770/m.101691 type:complete len:231 (+) Transcript_62770:663-1355(+)
MVPSVPICNGRAIANAGDLVAVVPPGHDPCICWRISLEPLVAIHVVGHDDGFAIFLLTFEGDGRMRHVWSNHLTVLDEGFDWFLDAAVAGQEDKDGQQNPEEPAHSREPLLHRINPLDNVGDLCWNSHRPQELPGSTEDGAHASTSEFLHWLLFDWTRRANQCQELRQTPVHDDAHRVTCKHGHDRAADDHQARHLEREVVRDTSKKHREELCRGLLVPAEENPDDCHPA